MMTIKSGPHQKQVAGENKRASNLDGRCVKDIVCRERPDRRHNFIMIGWWEQDVAD